MISITRVFHFEAAHWLPGHPKCGRVHGHSYRVEVTVGGPVDESGMVIDFGDLKVGVQHAVLNQVDHYALNEVLGPGIIPTAETLANIFAAWLRSYFEPNGGGKIKILRVKVWETQDSSATWERDS